MSDHAGGESSTLLNAALTATHDGIAGYWDGRAASPVSYELGSTDAEITYLRMSTRGLMLDHALQSAVHVGGANGKAVLGQVGAFASAKLPVTRLMTLKRPLSGVFEAQLNWMRSYADLRDDRIAEINVQIDDILSFFGAIALIDEQRRLRTLELLEATVRLCIHAELQIKHLCRAPRPVDLAHEVQPIVQTPDHSTFPSGHATEAFAVATVLHRLMTGEGPKAGLLTKALSGAVSRVQVFRLANRIAVNRTVAGVHFPVDTAAGALLGCIIGDLVYGLAAEQPVKSAPKFASILVPLKKATAQEDAAQEAEMAEEDRAANPARFPGAVDFDLEWLAKALPEDRKWTSRPAFDCRPQQGGTILQRYWHMAKAEWPM